MIALVSSFALPKPKGSATDGDYKMKLRAMKIIDDNSPRIMGIIIVIGGISGVIISYIHGGHFLDEAGGVLMGAVAGLMVFFVLWCVYIVIYMIIENRFPDGNP